jgi:hypothetical protein
MGYPRLQDEVAIAARRDLLRAPTPAALDAAITEPTFANVTAFRQVASKAYGGAGNQIQINVHLKGGPPAAAELARTIRHLLYGPGADVARLDQVLERPAYRTRGFGEALAVKSLSIVYPERWLPCFFYPGKDGKQAMMRLPELPLEPLRELGRSRAALAWESNEALRALMAPYFGEDGWGAVQFLWWRLQSSYGKPNAPYG